MNEVCFGGYDTQLLLGAVGFSAAAESKSEGKLLGEHLVKQGVVDEKDILRTLSKQLNIPVVSLARKRISPKILNILTPSFCLKNLVLPMGFYKGFLVVAMSNPAHLEIQDDIAFMTGYRVKPVIAGIKEIQGYLLRFHQPSRENQIVIKSYLENPPHVLTVTENGQEACEAFMAGRFDLVLMDMQMPVMDGHTATRTIRKWENEQSKAPTPIIALTAHAFQEDRQKCLEAGCNEYLSKPVKKKTLLAMLDSVCGEDGLGLSA